MVAHPVRLNYLSRIYRSRDRVSGPSRNGRPFAAVPLGKVVKPGLITGVDKIPTDINSLGRRTGSIRIHFHRPHHPVYSAGSVLAERKAGCLRLQARCQDGNKPCRKNRGFIS